MTLKEALETVAIGGSVEQTIWTEHPESAGIEPQDGMEYQIKIMVTKEALDSYVTEAQLLATRRKV